VATVWQVLLGEKSAQAGDYVLVYDQLGFHQATSTAELLAEKGCQVEVVTPQFYVGGDLSVTLDIELWSLSGGSRPQQRYYHQQLYRSASPD
jgi:2,4-dienoyl-CoA reductase (NADPH2)